MPSHHPRLPDDIVYKIFSYIPTIIVKTIISFDSSMESGRYSKASVIMRRRNKHRLSTPKIQETKEIYEIDRHGIPILIRRVSKNFTI